MLRDNIHKRSRLQENKAAKDYKGFRTPASGATWHSKGDVKTDDYLIECKSTINKSFSLKIDSLYKLKKQALIENKLPIFEVEFSDATYVILDKEDFLMLGGQCIT